MKALAVQSSVLMISLAAVFSWAAQMADAPKTAAAHSLQNIAAAAHHLDYAGTFVYRYGDHVETSRITHVVDGGGEHVRLESMDGEQREIIRNNSQVIYYVEGHKVLDEHRQAGCEFPALLPEQLALLNENYIIKPIGQARIAGYPAEVLLLQARDDLRYAHKIYADSASGLLLRAEALDSHGAVVEQYAFTQVTLGGVLDKSWINDKADAPAAGRDNPPNIVHHVPAGVPVSSAWRVDSLPPGFKKIIEVQRRLGKEGSVTQMVFSDGLAGISLFIEKSDSHEDEHPGLYSQGVIQVYSKIVHDSFITVVGEVPPQTAMQVADSVRFAGGTE